MEAQESLERRHVIKTRLEKIINKKDKIEILVIIQFSVFLIVF